MGLLLENIERRCKMRKLILEPDWRTTPILIDYSEGYDDWLELYGLAICPEELPLSKHLCNDLWAWSDLYDTQMDWSNAPEMFEWSKEQCDEFSRQGDVLLERLRSELGDSYEIKRGKFLVSA
jgi:hypothetical protein